MKRAGAVPGEPTVTRLADPIREAADAAPGEYSRRARRHDSEQEIDTDVMD
jgi:hypothetical protein